MSFEAYPPVGVGNGDFDPYGHADWPSFHTTIASGATTGSQNPDQNRFSRQDQSLFDEGPSGRSGSATDLMRALFLPIFACSLEDGDDEDPRCASLYKAQARDATSEWVRLDKLLCERMDENRGYLDEIVQLRASQATSLTANQKLLTDTRKLEVEVDRTNADIAKLAQQKTVIEKKMTLEKAENEKMIRELQDQLAAGECDAQIVKALENVTAETLDGTIDALSVVCDTDQMQRAEKLLRQVADLRAYKQRVKREKAKMEEEAEATKRFCYDALISLKGYVNANEFENADAIAFHDDWKVFALNKNGDATRKILGDAGVAEGDFNTTEYALTDDEENLRKEIYDILVQKVGNTRMMVRFNNAKGNVGKYAEGVFLTTSADKSDDFYGMRVEKKGNTYNSVRIKYRKGAMTVAQNIFTKHAQGHDRADQIPYNSMWKISQFKWSSDDVSASEPLNFERIFTTETQEEVFSDVKPFVLSALEGKNVAIIAYGGTGSGKTYTMGFEVSKSETTPKEEEEGLFPRLLKELMKDTRVESFGYQMMEVIPAVPPIKFKNNEETDKKVEYRVVDLIAANRGNYEKNTPMWTTRHTNANENPPDYVQKWEKDREKLTWNRPKEGTVFHYPVKGKNNEGFKSCKFQEKTDDDKQVKVTIKPSTNTTSLWKGVKFGPNDTNFYRSERNNALSNPDCRSGSIKDVPHGDLVNQFVSSDFASSDLQGHGIAELLNEYSGTIAMRRSDIKPGNEGLSSRTHLVTVITIRFHAHDKEPSKIFLVDLAGKETETGMEYHADDYQNANEMDRKQIHGKWLAAQRDNSLTKGINDSLGELIKVIEKKKRAEKNKESIDSSSDNPIFDILKPVWEPDAKIMVIACVYPLGGKTTVSKAAKSISDDWTNTFGFKEDGGLKLMRDAEVLEELGRIQNIKKS